MHDVLDEIYYFCSIDEGLAEVTEILACVIAPLTFSAGHIFGRPTVLFQKAAL